MKFRETIYYNVEEFERLKNMRNEGMFSVSMAVNLDYTGKERCNKGHRFGPFVRNCFLIHVVTDGRGIYRLKGRKYELGAGKAFVIFPGVETTYQASDEDPWTYYWVGMHGYNVEEFFSSIDVTPDDPIIELNDTREIIDSISEMIRTSQMTHANELIRLGQAIRFMGLLEKHRVRETGLNGEQRYPAKVYVEAAMAYIRSNYRGDVKIGEIAEYIGINRCYLARNFKKETDMTPKEYLINYRLERAALGLTSNDDPISQVAMRVGYPDQMAFSKAFKKKYGSSPQQYRKEQKQALVLKKQDVMLTRAK
jgi:AraC-like DNA-binding protein/mannose-6-phosphate isomerase-like protein (cupin superfamily)